MPTMCGQEITKKDVLFTGLWMIGAVAAIPAFICNPLCLSGMGISTKTFIAGSFGSAATSAMLCTAAFFVDKHVKNVGNPVNEALPLAAPNMK